MTRILAIVAVASVAAVVAIIGLGASGSNARAGAAGTHYGGGLYPAAGSRPAGGAAVGVRRTSLGRTLVDAQGRTLYLFEADRPNLSNCSSACLADWPALQAQAKPQARGGAEQSKLGTIRRSGGTLQVTYAGHPLYLYAGDRTPGGTNGQGLKQFGAAWYVLSPSGRKIDDD